MEGAVTDSCLESLRDGSLIWDVFSNGPILDCLGSHLEICDMVNLSRSCRQMSALYRCLRHQEWNVDLMLKRFVQKPKDFRHEIGRAEALITGSFALEYFSRPSWQAQNLDVVVAEEQPLVLLCQYLALVEGYELAAEDDAEGKPHGFRHIDRIYILRHSTDRSRIIHLYLVSLHAFPLKSIIEGCWATCLVNFISYRMAYSMFPSATFSSRGSYMLENLGRNWELPLQKYRDRDLETEVIKPPVFDRKNHAFQRCRKAGDKFSWKIPLDTTGMTVNFQDPVPEDEVIYLEQRTTQFERASLARLGFKTETMLADVETRTTNADGADIVETFHYERMPPRLATILTRSEERAWQGEHDELAKEAAAKINAIRDAS